MSPEILQPAVGCGLARAGLFSGPLTAAFTRSGIDTPLRQATFLGQVAHESMRFLVLEESMNYNTDALIAKFGRHRISVVDACAYGRKPGQSANQQTLANLLYGGARGRKNLGNTEPNDGWHFRGRGIKQLTGRGIFDEYEQATGQPVRVRPDLLTTPQWACDSTGFFWASRGCNAFADRRDCAGLTHRINGGSNGLADRVAATTRALRALGALAPPFS